MAPSLVGDGQALVSRLAAYVLFTVHYPGGLDADVDRHRLPERRLVQKLHACAAAGFDGVEVFEPDLVAAPESPEEIRALADRLGLTLDLYQPFRDAEGVERGGVRRQRAAAGRGEVRA